MPKRQWLAVVLVLGSAILTKTAFAQGASPADPEVLSLDEVVVTAQRREDRLLDVPLSVSVVNAQELRNAGVTSTLGLTTLVPGLSFLAQGTQAQPAIRGISSLAAAAGNEQEVATYLDGVYLPFAPANTFDLSDVQRVEVLKGPQGTLFGRNVVGGAVQVFTREPSFTPTASFDVSAGAFATRGGDYQASMFAAGPLIGNTLAGSISASRTVSDGYDYNIFLHEPVGQVHETSLRTKLLWNATENLSVEPVVWFVERDDWRSNQIQPLNCIANGVAHGGLCSLTPYRITTDLNSHTNNQQFGSLIRVTDSFAAGKLTSTSSYVFTIMNTAAVDTDGTSAPLVAELPDHRTDHVLQQEFNFASTDYGPLSYVTGLYYFNDDQRHDPLATVLNNVAIAPVWAKGLDVAYAAYGEGYWKATSHLMFVAGIRYSWERKQYDGGNSASALNNFIGDQSWGAWTPHFSVRYNLTDNTNIYATYTQGFKSGVFELTGLKDRPVSPEKVKGYEIGIKSAPIPNLTVTAAVFENKISDKQEQFLLANGLRGIQNAASAETAGLETEINWKVAQHVQLAGGISWLPTSKYNSYPNAVVNIQNGTGGLVSAIEDLSGDRLVRSPKYTADFRPSYSYDIGAGEFELTGIAYYTASYAYDTTGRVVQPGYFLLNGDLSFTPAGSNFRFSIWGKNLTNKIYTYSAPTNGNADNVVYAPPRSVGLEAKYSF
jgi:iron complex outermembrane receptor protein